MTRMATVKGDVGQAPFSYQSGSTGGGARGVSDLAVRQKLWGERRGLRHHRCVDTDGGAPWPSPTIPLLDTPIQPTDWRPKQITVTDPGHPLYGRCFDLISVTGSTTLRGHAHVAYAGTLVLRIPIVATSLHPAPQATLRTKLSLEAIRDLLRLTARDQPAGKPNCACPQPAARPASATSPPPSGR
jgi:hypothetical protein